MPTHPTALALAAQPLPPGQVFHFVFSNKTKHDDICLVVLGDLVAAGLNVWQQATNIPKDSDNWFKEWFPNAIKSVKIVCFISADYLRSIYCMKEFRVAQNKGKLLVVACEPMAEIMKVEDEIDQYPDASDALAYLMGGGQVIFYGQEDTSAEILKFMPRAQPEPAPAPQPALGPPPDQPAPQLSDIRTLAALSKATGENEADLLEYSEKEIDDVFLLYNVDIVGKKKIKREMVALRELLQTEPEPEPAEPEPEPAEPEPQHQPTYTEITTLSGHTNIVMALAIHDSKLYSGSYDKTITVWSLEAGDFGREITTLSGHTSDVYALAIQDSKLYSGSWDNTIKVWDV
jgi:hypothetical protein